MSALEQLRAAQHEDRLVASDVDLDTFLRTRTIDEVLADREPTSPVERDLLARARRSTP